MTRARQPHERDLHERFSAWLLHGAVGEPARDLALHGAFCPECRADMAALDLLPVVDTGRAPMPPSRRPAPPVNRTPFGPRLAWAAAAGLLVIAASGWAFGSGWLRLAPGSPSPAQQVLGGFGGGELSTATPLASDSQEESAAAASDATPERTTAASVAPAASPIGPQNSGSVAPTATDSRGPSRSPRPTDQATATPSASATPSPTPSPLPPQCSDLADNDGDDLVDLEDPGCSGPLDDDEADPPSAQRLDAN